MIWSEKAHLSHESGHAAGTSRMLVGIGMTMVGVGVLGFLVGVGLGFADSLDGVPDGSGGAWMLAAGGLAVVAGLFVAAVGMALARHAAGE